MTDSNFLRSSAEGGLTMDELKPCPFCGSHKIQIVVKSSWARVNCTNCRANINLEHRTVYDPEVAAEYFVPRLISTWNRRTDDGAKTD